MKKIDRSFFFPQDPEISSPFSEASLDASQDKLDQKEQPQKPRVAFKDVTEESGIHFTHLQAPDVIDSIKDVMGSGACAVDYNIDGFPDLYVVNGSGYNFYYDRQPWWYKGKIPTSVLYRNNQDGTFTDVTRQAGVAADGWGMGCATADYNNDGFTDIFITNFGQNKLYRNNGNGTFTNVTLTAFPTGNDPDKWKIT